MLQNPSNVYPFNHSISLNDKTSFSFIHHGSDVKYVALNIYDALNNSLVARYFSPNRLNEYDHELTLKDGDEFSMLLENLSDILKPAKEYKYNYTLYQEGGFSACTSYEETFSFDGTDTSSKKFCCRCAKYNLKQITITNSYSTDNIVKIYPHDLESGNFKKFINLSSGVKATVTITDTMPLYAYIETSANCKIKIMAEYYDNVFKDPRESNYNIFHTSTYVSDEVNNDMELLDENGEIVSSTKYVPCYSGLNIPSFMYDYNGLNIGGMAISINDVDFSFVDYYTRYENKDDVYYMKLTSTLKHAPRAGDKINIYKNFLTTPMYGFTVRTAAKIDTETNVKCGIINCNSTYTVNNINFKDNVKTCNWSIIKQDVIDTFNILNTNDSHFKTVTCSKVLKDTNFKSNLYLDPVSGTTTTKTGYYTSSLISLGDVTGLLPKGTKKITFNKSIQGASFYKEPAASCKCVGYCEPVKTVEGVDALTVLYLRESADYVRVCLAEDDFTSTDLTIKWESAESNVSLDSYVTSTQIPVAYYTSEEVSQYSANIGKYLCINGDYKKIKALNTKEIKRKYICFNDVLEHTLHFEDILGMWTLEFGDILVKSTNLNSTTKSFSKTTDYGYVDINTDGKGTIKFGRTIPAGAKKPPVGGVLELSIKNSIFVYNTEPFIIPPQIGNTCTVLNSAPITLYSTGNLLGTASDSSMPFVPKENEAYYTNFVCTNKYDEVITTTKQIDYTDSFNNKYKPDVQIESTEFGKKNYGLITCNNFDGEIYKISFGNDTTQELINQDLQLVYSGSVNEKEIIDYTASSGEWDYIFCFRGIAIENVNVNVAPLKDFHLITTGLPCSYSDFISIKLENDLGSFYVTKEDIIFDNNGLSQAIDVLHGQIKFTTYNGFLCILSRQLNVEDESQTYILEGVITYKDPNKWSVKTVPHTYNFESWDIYSLALIEANYKLGKDRYAVTNHWSFALDLTADSIVQNQDISIHESLSKFPQRTIGKNNYVTGGITCLLGNIDCQTEDYVDNYDKVVKWNQFITQDCPFMLKSPKGDVWVVTIDSSTERSYEQLSSQIPTQITFKYTQIDDIKNIIVDSEA